MEKFGSEKLRREYAVIPIYVNVVYNELKPEGKNHQCMLKIQSQIDVINLDFS